MYRRVHIKWYDAYSPDLDVWRTTESAIEQCEEVMSCETVGYIIHETEKAYIIADTIAWYHEGHMSMVRGLIHVPKSCVDLIEDI